ncbi:unnamed protein product [marine sediment metagenome]|uniref:Uncharacterized protein n=1 Tax=marine sediment metagenome TaxID=412755 RepID=X1GXW9_9ZZZZ
MTLHIKVITVEGEYMGKLYLEDKKIKIEAITEMQKEEFKDDIRLWKKNHKHLGVVDDETLFYKIPYITSHWSRVIFSGVTGNPDPEQAKRIAEEIEKCKKRSK